jgi:hypothetical protein
MSSPSFFFSAPEIKPRDRVALPTHVGEVGAHVELKGHLAGKAGFLVAAQNELHVLLSRLTVFDLNFGESRMWWRVINKPLNPGARESGAIRLDAIVAFAALQASAE